MSSEALNLSGLNIRIELIHLSFLIACVFHLKLFLENEVFHRHPLFLFHSNVGFAVKDYKISLFDQIRKILKWEKYLS